MSVTLSPTQENQTLFLKKEKPAFDLNSPYDMNTALKNVPVKTKPNLDNYINGIIHDNTAPPSDLSEAIQGVFLNGFDTLELKEGIEKLIKPHQDVVSVIAKKAGVNTLILNYKLGNIDSLQNIYDNSVQSMGIASSLVGLGGLMRLTKNASEIYNQYQKNDQKRKSIQKKQAIIQEFNDSIADKQISDTEIDKIQKKAIAKLQDITKQELNSHKITEKRQKINNAINQTADIISSVGNLVTVKNMIHTLRTPNAIPQAISALSNGAIVTGQTVTAIKIGVSLLAMGMTISSVSAMMNVAKSYLKSDTKLGNDAFDTEKINHTKKANNEIIQDSLITATEKITSGIGSAILLNNHSGFKIANLLNWNQNFMFNKMFAWSNAGLMLIGGTNAIIKATDKFKENQYLEYFVNEDNTVKV